MPAICENCSKPELLKKIVRASMLKGICNLCLETDLNVADVESKEFIIAIKALIRYNYSEWEYHSKLGGESFQTLLAREENPIFKINKNLDAIAYEVFLLSFIENFRADTSINLITAYGREIYQYRAMSAISLGDEDLLPRVRRDLRTKNYFLVEAEHGRKFHCVRPHVTKFTEYGEVWYRARIGAKRKAADFSYSPREESVYYEPHSKGSLAAPPVGLTTAGRLNRPGVSFLYLASDKETAIAEVRPHPGEMVSLGGFTISRRQSIADFTTHSIVDLYQSDKDLEILELIIAIENCLVTAAPPSNRSPYSLTQYIADIFRNMGFDGIKFRSTVGKGVNLVLFDPSQTNWVEGSSSVVAIDGVQYSHSPRKLFDSNEIYDIDLDIMQNRSDGL